MICREADGSWTGNSRETLCLVPDVKRGPAFQRRFRHTSTSQGQRFCRQRPGQQPQMGLFLWVSFSFWKIRDFLKLEGT